MTKTTTKMFIFAAIAASMIVPFSLVNASATETVNETTVHPNAKAIAEVEELGKIVEPYLAAKMN